MIKVEVYRKNDITKLVFEARDKSNEGLDRLDEIYQAILGSGAKRGGYLGSHRFEVEVRDEDPSGE